MLHHICTRFFVICAISFVSFLYLFLLLLLFFLLWKNQYCISFLLSFFSVSSVLQAGNLRFWVSFANQTVIWFLSFLFIVCLIFIILLYLGHFGFVLLFIYVCLIAMRKFVPTLFLNEFCALIVFNFWLRICIVYCSDWSVFLLGFNLKVKSFAYVLQNWKKKCFKSFHIYCKVLIA